MVVNVACMHDEMTMEGKDLHMCVLLNQHILLYRCVRSWEGLYCSARITNSQRKTKGRRQWQTREEGYREQTILTQRHISLSHQSIRGRGILSTTQETKTQDEH
jgi:hypothetical protein